MDTSGFVDGASIDTPGSKPYHRRTSHFPVNKIDRFVDATHLSTARKSNHALYRRPRYEQSVLHQEPILSLPFYYSYMYHNQAAPLPRPL